MWTPEGEFIKRVDLFSDLRPKEQISIFTAPVEISHSTDTTAVALPIEDKNEELRGDHSVVDSTNSVNVVVSDTLPANESHSTQEAQPEIGIINGEALEPFFAKLRGRENLRRVVRVAVLGDSFFEGDIFVQDFREMMQERFGGNGVGYMPLSYPYPGFRRSVTHSFSGWEVYSIGSHRRGHRYTFNPELFAPNNGAYASYKGTDYRKGLDSFTSAKLLYTNNGQTQVVATIDDTIKHTYTPPTGDSLQLLSYSDSVMRKVRYNFPQASGFKAYGVYLDGHSGVAVDNYSYRGNTGVSIANGDSLLLEQFDELMHVDLIIMEFGLNVIDAARRNYDTYIDNMRRSIALLRSTMPSTPILMIGVGDRVYSTAGGKKTMPGAYSLDKAQKELALETGLAYWSLLTTMKDMGGITAFVKRRHAASDYTHLSPRGGEVLAERFFDQFISLYNGDNK